MPKRAKSSCDICGKASDGKCCQKRQYRASSSARGYNYQWRKYRLKFLALNPLCVECLTEDITEAADTVDHITAHRGDEELFWDVTNHQAMCKYHHDRKTGRGE